MLIRPPKPPKPSITKARPVASTAGRFQGKAAIQPNKPRPPRSRPAISSDAVMVKMVSSVGTETKAVSRTWMNFQPLPCCGSIIRWCMPTGRLNTKNRMKVSRPMVSL
jgi:hypothetical protein